MPVWLEIHPIRDKHVLTPRPFFLSLFFFGRARHGQGYGYIVEIRMQADRGFAFVKLDTHEHAAQAICNLQNYQVHGRPIKCSWGKDREGGATAAGGAGAGVGGVGAGVASPVGMAGMQQPGAMNMGMMG